MAKTILPLRSFFLATTVLGLSVLLCGHRNSISGKGQTRPSATLQDSILKLDPQTGLKLGKGLELVKLHCTGCHSAKIITQFRSTREGWVGKIRWMQSTQNLWDLGESEPAILDYLTKNYAPERKFDRREPLSKVQWYELR